MIAVKTLLAHLTQADVAEVCIEAGKRPTARTGSAAHVIADQAISADDLVQLLFATGGSRYVESLSDKPSQWRTRVEGVGAVVVTAAMRGDVMEARFSLRDGPPPRAATKTPTVPPARAPRGRDGVPSSRRDKLGKSARSPGFLKGEDHEERPSGVPTPRAHIKPPREAMPSNLEIDLDIGATDIPSVPQPLPPAADPFFGGRTEAFPGVAPTPATPGVAPKPEPRAGLKPGQAAGLRPSLRPAPPEPAVASSVASSGPPSPRTLPEARFSRDEPEPQPRRKTGPARPDFDVQEPSEPFAMSVRTPPAGHVVESPPKVQRGRTFSGRTTRPFAREPHTQLFRRLLRSARDLWASDLHLVAGRPPLVRVAGQLAARGEPLDALTVEDMILYRVPARLHETFEREGSCEFSLEEPELGRFRVSAVRQRSGFMASFRLIAQSIPTLAQLGMPEAIAAAARHTQGLVLFTGPAGQGKTTTQAAFVDLLNGEGARHIVILEDPIEYMHPRRRALVSQREVGAHTRSLQAALRAVLREDPDVIVVGELRDAEAAQTALAACEAGHLVLATMATPSAARTIDRLIDLFPLGDQPQARATLAGALKLVVGQRLLPDAEGKAMVAAAEVLPGMVPLWNLIRDNRTYQIPSLQQRGKGLGVIRLDDSLADLVRAGKVTPANAIAAAEVPDELEQMLGIRKPSVTMARVAEGSVEVSPRGTSPIRPLDHDGGSAPKPPPPPPLPGRSTTAPEPKGIFERAGALFKKGS